jgi:hypothetical protein
MYSGSLDPASWPCQKSFTPHFGCQEGRQASNVKTPQQNFCPMVMALSVNQEPFVELF